MPAELRLAGQEISGYGYGYTFARPAWLGGEVSEGLLQQRARAASVCAVGTGGVDIIRELEFQSSRVGKLRPMKINGNVPCADKNPDLLKRFNLNLIAFCFQKKIILHCLGC